MSLLLNLVCYPLFSLITIAICAGRILLDHVLLTSRIMGWLNKIFKGSSSHKISQGQYHGKYGDDGIWTEQSSNLVIANLQSPLLAVLPFFYSQLNTIRWWKFACPCRDFGHFFFPAQIWYLFSFILPILSGIISILPKFQLLAWPQTFIVPHVLYAPNSLSLDTSTHIFSQKVRCYSYFQVKMWCT